MGTRDLTGGASKPPRRFRPNRICRAPMCNVRLSRYNPEEYCGVHAQLKDFAVVQLPLRHPEPR